MPWRTGRTALSSRQYVMTIPKSMTSVQSAGISTDRLDASTSEKTVPLGLLVEFRIDGIQNALAVGVDTFRTEPRQPSQFCHRAG